MWRRVCLNAYRTVFPCFFVSVYLSTCLSAFLLVYRNQLLEQEMKKGKGRVDSQKEKGAPTTGKHRERGSDGFLSFGSFWQRGRKEEVEVHSKSDRVPSGSFLLRPLTRRKKKNETEGKRDGGGFLPLFSTASSFSFSARRR
mmetsp:Transcript_8105/g.15829  ORF Transcript_8105/g.15829 Transcript_8105/m.15829 type:complete len:142 (+) Transcript_8105:162-587(+)